MLPNLLHHNVPRFIAHIQNRGGVTDDEMHWLRCEDDTPEYPEGLFNRADEYLLYPKDQATFEKGLFVLVRAIAIMSFVPGGVHIFGLHFSSQIENFVVIEDGSGET
ncbi:hypothetical protein [Chroococcidiopsis sp.]|uniref:hypothetical protein n=1 Tax=Chroococcidiopsis sp. TaxID=3088168 RepID=UPI003F2C1B94